MRASSSRHDDLTQETIEDALKFVDVNVSRDKWARIGMALKSELGEGGWPLFRDWSKDGRTYNERDCESTWKSLGAGGGVNIGTLIYEAQQAGFDLSSRERQTLSDDQIADRKKKREEEQKAAEAEKRRKYGEAAKLANLTWEAAKAADDQHPYLVTKGVRAYGLGRGEWPILRDDGTIWHLPDALLIPINDAKTGKTMSLQGIMLDPYGEIQKSYLKNGRKKGGFHMIGTPPNAGDPLAFCEGYATGATIHELTGWPVIVTFDAPNLPAVAAILRDKFPAAGFIICADNDAWAKLGDIENPGMHYVRVAAQANRAVLIAPRFMDTKSRPTDWNDLAQLEGKHIALAQLMDNPITRSKVAVVDSPLPVPGNDNIDYFTPLPHVGGKGRPLATIENVAEVISRLGITARYNVISKSQEILVPGESYLIDNRDNDAFARVESECARFAMPIGNLNGFIGHIAGQNPFNPVAQWIASKPWDGALRLQQLYDTVIPVEDKRLPDGRSLKEILMRRWMMSAIVAGFSPDGVSAHGVLVFQGAQYLGKTMWFKQLVPEHLGLLQDGMMLKPDDKDSVKQVCSFWLVELGELDATFRKSDLAALKSFIPRQKDVLRLPYARKESQFARRTVFFGSVNPREFLHDITGNRRYWTIECSAIDLEAQRQLDMQQVWAEAYALWMDGEGHFLTALEMAALNGHNEDFQAIDPIKERLQTRLDWDAPDVEWSWRTALEILLGTGLDRPTNGDMQKAGHFMRELNEGQRRTSRGRNQLRCPPLVGQPPDSRRPF